MEALVGQEMYLGFCVIVDPSHRIDGTRFIREY